MEPADAPTNSNASTTVSRGINLGLRWLALLSLVITLSLSRGVAFPVQAVLAAGMLGSSLLTIWVARSPASRLYPVVAVIFDLSLTSAVFYFSEMAEGAIFWAGVLPVVSAAMLLHAPGLLIVILGSLLLQSGLLALLDLGNAMPFFLLVMSPIYIVVGAVTYLISHPPAWRIAQSPGRKLQEEQRKQREYRQGVIVQMIGELSASLDYNQVLENTLDLTSAALKKLGAPSDGLVGAALFFSGPGAQRNLLLLVSGRGLASADLRTSLPGLTGVIGSAVETGKPAFTGDVSHDPELSQFVSLGAAQSGYCLPLRAGRNTYGVLLFAHTSPDFFTPENREILDIATNQVVIAIHNAQLYHDLQVEKKRMMDIQDEAQRKLARELQAGPTRDLAEISSQVNNVRHLLAREPQVAEESLQRIEERARQTTKEIRHMLFTLRPLVLETQGLLSALETMAQKVKDTYQTEVLLQVDTTIADRLEDSRQSIVFYLVEEAVTNARKHGQASRIWVSLTSIKRNLALLEIRDDGKGFNVAEARQLAEREDSGIGSMFERAELLNGMLHIESNPMKGTRVQVAIPLSGRLVAHSPRRN